MPVANTTEDTASASGRGRDVEHAIVVIDSPEVLFIGYAFI
jgi:hypothetical protein